MRQFDYVDTFYIKDRGQVYTGIDPDPVFTNGEEIMIDDKPGIIVGLERFAVGSRPGSPVGVLFKPHAVTVSVDLTPLFPGTESTRAEVGRKSIVTVHLRYPEGDGGRPVERTLALDINHMFNSLDHLRRAQADAKIKELLTSRE